MEQQIFYLQLVWGVFFFFMVLDNEIVSRSVEILWNADLLQIVWFICQNTSNRSQCV